MKFPSTVQHCFFHRSGNYFGEDAKLNHVTSVELQTENDGRLILTYNYFRKDADEREGYKGWAVHFVDGTRTEQLKGGTELDVLMDLFRRVLAVPLPTTLVVTDTAHGKIYEYRLRQAGTTNEYYDSVTKDELAAEKPWWWRNNPEPGDALHEGNR